MYLALAIALVILGVPSLAAACLVLLHLISPDDTLPDHPDDYSPDLTVSRLDRLQRDGLASFR
jgi:hypothetical protein